MRRSRWFQDTGLASLLYPMDLAISGSAEEEPDDMMSCDMELLQDADEEASSVWQIVGLKRAVCRHIVLLSLGPARPASSQPEAN